MNRSLWLTCLFVAILAAPSSSLGAPPPEIRVMVMDDIPAVTVDGMGSHLKYMIPSNRSDMSIGKKAVIRADASGLVMNGKSVGEKITIFDRERAYSIGERSFSGELVIAWKSDGKLVVVNQLPLERYLVGLIGSEISPRWPIESIKAQAVAARTYALNLARGSNPSKLYDITSTVSSQVYHGSHVEDPKATEAVEATAGEILYRNGSIFPTYYHSCCGGLTEHAHNVWNGESGPPTMEDKFCARSPKEAWAFEVSIPKFIETLKQNDIPLTGVLTIATTTFPDSPRVQMMLIEDDGGLKMVEATELRKIFGYMNIKSTWFEASLQGNKIFFKGRGYGHGVGMCQWGAKGMAEAGHDYREILKFYYSDAELGKAY